jgi:hypothetical protein
VRLSAAAALFTLLTAVMTWPQAASLGTAAHDHQDVYFNMWRFAWVAHALLSAPSRLFDGNIFHPEPRTLTFSDAMPIEAVIAAPLLWAGTPPVLVHNTMLLGAIVLSAVGMFVLARLLTGSSAAAITAGLVFAFAPYRFEHYMHMELQWTVWIPWAFWAVHRALDTGRRRYGALAGAFVALQFMSSIYYGVFLATLLGLAGVLLLCGLRLDRLKRGMAALAAGGTLAVALCLPYVIPYLETKRHLGGRPEEQIVMFSARPASYTVATDTNFLYGARSRPRGRPERRLFPGILPLLLGVAGLLLRPPTKEAVVYLLALVAAFEMSLGLYGYSYSFLHRNISIFEGLRAPARLGLFVVFFLGLLAAYGHAAIEAPLAKIGRFLVAAAVWSVLLLEYWVAPLRLVDYPNTPPPLYEWLAQQPPGIVAELPIPPPAVFPVTEARHTYMSTFHWMPLINGYSGYYPPSYVARLDSLSEFPSDASTAVLWKAGVRYVILHLSHYSPDGAEQVLTEVASNPSFTVLGRFDDGRGDAVVYRLR